jgi:hypothetical protein
MRNYILPVLVLKLARRLFINDEIDEARGSASIGFAVMQSVKTISFRKSSNAAYGNRVQKHSVIFLS